MLNDHEQHPRDCNSLPSFDTGAVLHSPVQLPRRQFVSFDEAAAAGDNVGRAASLPFRRLSFIPQAAPKTSAAASPTPGRPDMQDSKFWRVIAVALCFELLYIGHGLHNGPSSGVPSLVNSARAGVTVQRNDGSGYRIYTTDASGRRMYVWGAAPNEPLPQYVDSVVVPQQK
jgi:hypothetical protein